MNIITDEILHLYIINPLLVDDNIKREIENRILDDIDFQKRFDEIKKFHSEFDYIIPSGITKLYPIKQEGNNLKYPKLAAANTKEKENIFKYFTSFVSADNIIIVRIQKNEATNEFKLHLITEYPVDFSKVKINIGGYGKEITPDSKGIALINDYNIDYNTNIHVNLGLEK